MGEGRTDMLARSRTLSRVKNDNENSPTCTPAANMYLERDEKSMTRFVPVVELDDESDNVSK